MKKLTSKLSVSLWSGGLCGDNNGVSIKMDPLQIVSTAASYYDGVSAQIGYGVVWGSLYRVFQSPSGFRGFRGCWGIPPGLA